MRAQRQVITFTVLADDTSEVEHTLPAKFEVCGTCRGSGTHVNPSIDGNGLTREDFDEDPDFRDAYFDGVYDVTCQTCGGQRVVPVVDEERADKGLLALYQKQQEDQERHNAECRSERMWESRMLGEY